MSDDAEKQPKVIHMINVLHGILLHLRTLECEKKSSPSGATLVQPVQVTPAAGL